MPATPEPLRLELLLEPRLTEISRITREAERCLDGAGVPAEVSYAVQLALEEGLSNVIRHAFAGRPASPIRVRLEVGGAEVVIAIEDEGTPFDPTAGELPPTEPFARGGRGLRLLRGVVDTLSYRRQGERNRLELRIDGTKMRA